MNAEREKLGEKPIEEKDDQDDDAPEGEMAEKTVSTTDSDAGMFIKVEHERQFAYEVHPPAGLSRRLERVLWQSEKASGNDGYRRLFTL